MAIIQTVNQHQIIDIAKAYNHLDNFGYHGWQKLFEYMENLSDEMGEDMELDIVAWCCEYEMCNSIEEFYDRSGMHFMGKTEWDELDEEEKLEAIEDYLNDNTSVVCCEDDCIIFAAF